MTTPPRTLAEALRARDDESLAGLLRARPDLLNPVPGDITQLATRAGTRASVVRALEHLDRFALQTAEALAVAADPAPYETLLGLLTGDGRDDGEHHDDAGAAIADALPGALATLREQALVWGEDDRLRLVRTAREILAPSPQHASPTGLGPTVAEATSGMSPGRLQEILAAAGLPATHDPVSAVAALSALFTDRARMGALLDTAPAEALSVLDRLVWGPPYGEVTPNPTPPVKWLRDHGLLLPVSTRTVVLPREAALHLRAGRAHRVPEPRPPAVEAVAERDPQAVDGAAAGQALLAVNTVEELLKGWNGGGPAILRAGGLSVRELKRTATALEVPEQVAAFWVELAYAAGLLASDGEADERYAPTPAYDDWAELPAQERWTALATAWLAATRTPGLVGGQDAKGRALSALGPELDRSAAPEVRHRVLALLADLAPGTAPDPETVLARLRWERPLRGASVSPGTPPICGPGSPCGRSTSPSSSASPAAAPSPPTPAPCSTPGPPRPPRCSPRSSPSRWTTSCSRPTSRPSPPARWSARWRTCSPPSRTSSRRAARRSTASPPARCAAPWTPGSPPPTCTPSSPPTAVRPSRSRSAISSTTWPAATATSGSAPPPRTCAATTRPY